MARDGSKKGTHTQGNEIRKRINSDIRYSSEKNSRIDRFEIERNFSPARKNVISSSSSSSIDRSGSANALPSL